MLEKSFLESRSWKDSFLLVGNAVTIGLGQRLIAKGSARQPWHQGWYYRCRCQQLRAVVGVRERRQRVRGFWRPAFEGM